MLGLLFFNINSANAQSKAIVVENDTIVSKGEKFVVGPSVFEKGTPMKLTVSDCLVIDSILKQCVEDYNKEFVKRSIQNSYLIYRIKSYLIEGFEEYYRQYSPIIDENGDKVVWVYCSCEDIYIEDSFVVVEDGGKCFFNVKINLTKMTYYELSVNGLA